MKKSIRHSFEELHFTEEEKMTLAQRLQCSAEQEETMKDSTKKKIKKLGRGTVLGIAAALTLTAGALAAVMHGEWGGLFSFQSGEEQELLEKLAYEIRETKTVDGWEITLSRCAGDDTMLYIWVDMKAPADFTGKPPEDYMDLRTYWGLEIDGKSKLAGSGNDRINWDEETRTVTYCSGWPTTDPVAGEAADIRLHPLRWGGWNRETEKWVNLPLWEGDVVFEDVELAYEDHTIRLAPNVEVPYLEGTATLTKLEISPFRAFARVDGGSIYKHHHEWVKAEEAPQAEQGVVIETEAGSITVGGSSVGSAVFDGYRVRYKTVDCWSALEVELHMKDGTVITPRTAPLSECQDGFDTEGHVDAGEYYVERRMEYEDIPIAGIADRIIDPDQVDYVTVCGVEVPVVLETEK